MSQNEDLVKLLNGLLASKQNVTSGDMAVASPYLDGLLDKGEAAGMINGFLGAKGAVADQADIDNVQAGGIYLLADERTYKNSPFYLDDGSTPRMQLIVARTYHTDPNSGNPLIYQEVRTVETTGSVKTAYRFMWNNTFFPWYYPQGVTLWEGLQSIRSGSFKLAQSVTNFSRVVVYWKPYLQGGYVAETSMIVDNSEIDLNRINNPNSSGSTIALTSEEVIMTPSSDGKTLTSESSFYSMVDGGKVTANPENAGKSMIRRIVGVPYF